MGNMELYTQNKAHIMLRILMKESTNQESQCNKRKCCLVKDVQITLFSSAISLVFVCVQINQTVFD